MSSIDDWRQAVARRNAVKAIRDLVTQPGHAAAVRFAGISTQTPGGTPSDIDPSLRDYIASVVDPLAIITAALQAARDDVRAKASLARAEAEQVIQDTAP